MDTNSTPATRLAALDMDEVSGVDVPANDGIGGWMVLKSVGSDLGLLADELQEQTEKAADPSALSSVLEKVRAAHDELATAIASSSSDSVPEMSNPYKPDVKTTASEGDKEKNPMQKSFDNLAPEVVEYIEELEAGIDVLADDLVAAQKALDEAVEKAADQSDADEIEKAALPESVRKALDDMQAENERLTKAVEQERTTRLDAEATKKAARWEVLTLKADEFGPALRRVEDIDPELAIQIERALDAANTAVSTTKAFDEIGSTAKSATTGAWGEIEALAKSKSTELGISFAEAVTVVSNERPDLYRRHQQEV